MSTDGPSAEWVPPGWDPPSPSQGGTAASPWPPAPPVPPMAPTRPWPLVSWLAGPAGSRLLTAAALVTAAGWCAAAAVFGATVVTGHAQAVAAVVASASVFGLCLVDLVVLISRGWRKGSQPEPPGAARAFRKAARRARRAAGAGPGVLRAVRGAARSRRRPARFPFLPRPARWGFTAMLWLTALVTAWVLARGFYAWDLGTARGQLLFAAWSWMTHLVVWCRIACGRLNGGRSEATMLTSAPTATRT